MEPFDAVRGKCVWWREVPNAEDQYDLNVKPDAKRIECSCFVEGYRWTFVAIEVPPDCPSARSCRYFVKGR
jgi:hypothetical protein